MHFVVCIKQAPDSAQIRVRPVTNTIMRQGMPLGRHRLPRRRFRQDQRSVKPLIEGSEVKEYAAHLIPEGGYKAVPELCGGGGWVVVGDATQLNNEALSRRDRGLVRDKGPAQAQGHAGAATSIRAIFFLTYPELVAKAMESFVRVDGTPKREKEKTTFVAFRKTRGLSGMAGNAFKLARAWR